MKALWLDRAMFLFSFFLEPCFNSVPQFTCKLFNLSGPQFPHLEHGDSNPHFTRLLGKMPHLRHDTPQCTTTGSHDPTLQGRKLRLRERGCSVQTGMGTSSLGGFCRGQGRSITPGFLEPLHPHLRLLGCSGNSGRPQNTVPLGTASSRFWRHW